jgi:hypothetical protein
VTLVAAHSSVPPLERKPRVDVVPEAERGGAEPAGGVAGVAAALELAAVDVFVTGGARRGQRLVADRLGRAAGKRPVLEPMTAGAASGLMLSGQGKRRPAVLERRRREALDPVAAAAVRGELSGVRVLAVAVGAASERQVLELPSRMAAGAGNRAVLSQEGKPSPPVVEASLRRPTQEGDGAGRPPGTRLLPRSALLSSR